MILMEVRYLQEQAIESSFDENPYGYFSLKKTTFSGKLSPILVKKSEVMINLMKKKRKKNT